MHTRRRFGVAGICLAVVTVLPPIIPAWAEEANEVDYTEMSLEQLMAIPITTAAKHEQKITDAPSSVTVLTAQDIRAYGWRTLGDLLRSTPGFYVTYPRSYGFVGVRGFGRPGDFGGRVLLLLNGHRMNDPLYDTAAVMNDFILDMDLIDRVEIVRGPGSALYGNNAVFAVVNVMTKRAEQIGGVEASGEAGTYDTYRGRLTYGTRTTNGTEVLVSGSGFTSDGNPHVHFPEYDSPETGNGVVHDGDGEAARSVYASIRQGGLTVDAAYVGRDKDSPGPAYGTVFGKPRRTYDGRGLLEGRYEHPLTESMQVKARLYYDWYEYWGKYPYDVAEPGQPQELIINRDESVTESVGSELQLNWQPCRQHAVTVGAEYRYDFRQMMKNFDVSPRTDYLDINPRTWYAALYAQDEYRPLTNLAFTAGVRYDHYDTFGDTVNPRLACIYNPVAATTLKFLYGKAFRAPNVNEFFYEDEGQTSKLNPDLKPEKISTYEIVCEQRFNARWHGSVAGFRNDVSDLIDQAQDPEDGLYYSVESRQSHRSGRGIPTRRAIDPKRAQSGKLHAHKDRGRRHRRIAEQLARASGQTEPDRAGFPGLALCGG